jgi:phospholipase/carboxylesterase
MIPAQIKDADIAMTQLPDLIEHDHGARPQYAVIWLHGLGADGHDFEPVVPALKLSPEVGVRFVFPHAPLRPVTVNGGMVMRAWYDIESLDIASMVDAEGVEASAQTVRALIARETERGIASDRVILAGFSQGGAIALQTALLYPEPLAGVIALSTYLPLPAALTESGRSANRAIPIFMGHGTYDPVVPLALGDASHQQLQALGYQVEWRTYPMEHSVNMDEIHDIGVWLRNVIRP